MGFTLLDQLAQGFILALKGGQAALLNPAFGLLGILAVITFYRTMGSVMVSGGYGAGDAIASCLLLCIRIGFFSFLLFHIVALSEAAFLSFLQWGLASTGGSVTLAMYQTPSLIIHTGFLVAAPFATYLSNMAGWAGILNAVNLAIYLPAYTIILVAFALVAIQMLILLVEFYLAILAATILLPWGILAPTAFLGETAIAWVAGLCVRIFITTALLGIAIPLFDVLARATPAGVDPSIVQAFTTAVGAVIFATLTYAIPARAAGIAGRGTSLALTGSTVASGVASVVHVARSVIRGASQLLNR
jgi:type IV secretion system protein TrbL